MTKDFSELRFTDDFMFSKVLSTNTELCRKIIELLLQKPIKKVELVDVQKPIDITGSGRGIRLDVYVNDENGTVYDLEMQTTDQKCLDKRSRYYQGMLDLNMIERGSLFSALKESYIIFICLEDHFGKSLPVYTFKNTCLEYPCLQLEDDTTKIFINAKGNRTNLSSEMGSFLDYLINAVPADGLTNEIEANVKRIQNNDGWRLEYMTFEMKLNMMREEGREEGLEKGRIEGLE